MSVLRRGPEGECNCVDVELGRYAVAFNRVTMRLGRYLDCLENNEGNVAVLVVDKCILLSGERGRHPFPCTLLPYLSHCL